MNQLWLNQEVINSNWGVSTFIVVEDDNVTQLSAEKVGKKFCKGFPPCLESDAVFHSNGMIVEWGVGGTTTPNQDALLPQPATSHLLQWQEKQVEKESSGNDHRSEGGGGRDIICWACAGSPPRYLNKTKNCTDYVQ